MPKVGVVGSGNYENKSFVIHILDIKISKQNDIIVSGHSPRNPIKWNEKGKAIDWDNVDIWSEKWAYSNCKIEPIIHPAKINNKDGFFARNKLVAIDSEELKCFIPKGQYRSGTWNTIKHFTKRLFFNINKIEIYNEFGELWTFKEMPNWLQLCKKQPKIGDYL